MQLSKITYYSDFVVYPIVISALAAAALVGATWRAGTEWLGAAFAGFILWTFMEYVLHRIALHRVSIFVPMHGLHHSSPLALVGTPLWMSVLVLSGAIGVPTWLCLGFNIAGGVTGGVMLGYWWYGVVHHVIHHHAHKPSHGYFGGLRAWHMRHHYSPRSGNFGVTTALWDYVFGTAIGSPVRRKGAIPS
jgi:sterol desaturase/sphingolipid hydroxylase (fatty acid hydroxylase superfamily)